MKARAIKDEGRREMHRSCYMRGKSLQKYRQGIFPAIEYFLCSSLIKAAGDIFFRKE
jgi:hypothetical protein